MKKLVSGCRGFELCGGVSIAQGIGKRRVQRVFIGKRRVEMVELD